MSNESLPILTKSYELYKLSILLHNNLEKRWRYSLGMTTEKAVLDCIGNLIMAQHAPKPHRATYLIKASAQLEIIMLHLRLYMELKLGNQTQLYQIHANAREIGRMLGGWLKASHNI